MELGQLVDFVIQYNELHDPEREEKKQAKGIRRKAKQADWDMFLG